jgi:hypothetical protein
MNRHFPACFLASPATASALAKRVIRDLGAVANFWERNMTTHTEPLWQWQRDNYVEAYYDVTAGDIVRVHHARTPIEFLATVSGEVRVYLYPCAPPNCGKGLEKMQSIPDQIRSQSGETVTIETGQGTAVISREDARKLLAGGELFFDGRKWVVK